MKYCFVFVCQGGRLEWMSALLASSLKHNLRCDYELVAAIPNYPEVQLPTHRTKSFLQSLGVRLTSIGNPIDPSYPIANKLACIDIETSAQKLIFLDSDMLCTNEFHHQTIFEEKQFSAKLTDLADLSLADWRTIYRRMNRVFPSSLVRATVTAADMPLCFNSGFIALDTKSNFGARWIEVARAMNTLEGLPGARPFLDQLSLPFALLDSGLRFSLLDESYNYPSEIRPIDVLNPPIFCHYHHLSHLLAEPFLCELLGRLVQQFNDLKNISMPAPLAATIGLPSR